MKSKYDVVILGAGHNGLVAAAYLAGAGLRVLLLEKNDYIGGATTSQKVFPDYDASLSRYSYLVSLFPEKIIRDLGLDLELRRRTVASYTPYVKDGRYSGFAPEQCFGRNKSTFTRRIDRKRRGVRWNEAILRSGRIFAEKVWDTMLSRFEAKEDLRRRFDADRGGREAWRSLVEEPLGCAIERYLQDDLVRGLAFTDAKIGVFTHPHDETFLQNRCFLYHLIGNKTGEWKVPVGGMGNVARKLEHVARRKVPRS